MAFTHQLIIIYYEGVTTVLTMTFLGLEARTDLPQVSYPTALDYFVFISFMFIFSTVVQVWKKYASTYTRNKVWSNNVNVTRRNL